MSEIEKHFRTLDLPADASLEDVKAAYRDLVKVWHPDRFAHDERLQKQAQEKLTQINAAREAIEKHLQSTESSATPRRPGKMWMMVAVLFGALGLVWWWTAQKLTSNSPGVSPPAAQRMSAPSTNNMLGLRALKFLGSQARLEIATTGSLSRTFTVECWAQTRKAKGTCTVVSSQSPDNFGFDIKFRQGKRFHGDIGDGTKWNFQTANGLVKYEPGVWYHIAYVVTMDDYKIYINGEWAGANAFTLGKPLLYDDRHRLVFGFDPRGGDELSGSLADIRIWQTERTEVEIRSNMKRMLTGDEPGLRAYWPLTEGAGNVVHDQTGLGQNGNLLGDVAWDLFNYPTGSP